MTHGELVHATNQGTQTVTSLKFEFLVDSHDITNGGDDHQDDEDVAEALRIVSENDDGDVFEIDAEDEENLIQKSDAGDAGNNELAPGEYIPFGIRVDLPDAPIDEISGAQDITLRIIAESGDEPDDDDEPEPEPGTELTLVEGPITAAGGDNIELTVEADSAISVGGFRIDFESPGENEPETFTGFVVSQNGDIAVEDDSGGEVGDSIIHSNISLSEEDSVSYDVTGFDTGPASGNLDVEFTLLSDAETTIGSVSGELEQGTGQN